MNYRKIPQLVADELRPLEAYLYLLLASKSDYNTLESDHGVGSTDHSWQTNYSKRFYMRADSGNRRTGQDAFVW